MSVEIEAENLERQLDRGDEGWKNTEFI